MVKPFSLMELWLVPTLSIRKSTYVTTFSYTASFSESYYLNLVQATLADIFEWIDGIFIVPLSHTTHYSQNKSKFWVIIYTFSSFEKINILKNHTQFTYLIKGCGVLIHFLHVTNFRTYIQFSQTSIILFFGFSIVFHKNYGGDSCILKTILFF